MSVFSAVLQLLFRSTVSSKLVCGVVVQVSEGDVAINRLHET
jgi:hypothetical protein